MKLRKILLMVTTISAWSIGDSKAQDVGMSQGNFIEISSLSGYAQNNIMNKKWLYRNSSGIGWTSTSIFDGISVDVSFLTPYVDARTWWRRTPVTETQSWGTRDETYLTLNGPNFGIGTDNPQARLEVQSLTNGWLINSRTNAFNSGDVNGMRFYSGYIGENKWAGVSSIAEDINSNNTALSLYAGQTEKVRILTNGNVGIGTATPQAKLEVQSAANGWLINSRAAAINPGELNGIRFYSGYVGENWKWAGMASVAEDINSNNTSLALFTNQSEKVRVLANGNMGIGTSTPNAKLAVNGNIRAHELRVETANWPDYVFDQDYKMLGLIELDAYIKANKHLPEMPSAKEVEANGMALGEMVKLQQKKIEELTLHLIEKDKQLTTQQEELMEIKSILQKLTGKK